MPHTNKKKSMQPSKGMTTPKNKLQSNIESNNDQKQRRLQQLQAHLNPSSMGPSPTISSTPTTTTTTTTTTTSSTTSPSSLSLMFHSQKQLDAKQKVYQCIRQHNRVLFSNDFMSTEDLSRGERMNITWNRVQYLTRVAQLFSCHEMFNEYETHTAKLEALNQYDENLFLKVALQFNFFAGSMHHLGTPNQSQSFGTSEFYERVNRLEVIGCFAITELSHGSNVSAIETVATLDVESQQFVIHSPRKQSMKWWIGNAAHAHMCITFAQLYIGGVCYGVHAFVVPLRNTQTNAILSGVTIGDCGPKIGYNNVDNGYIVFDRVRIPLDHMLNRFAKVTINENNVPVYVSSISNSAKRFGAMLSQLTMGRSSLVTATACTYAMGLRAAIPYAFERTQFAPVASQPAKATAETSATAVVSNETPTSTEQSLIEEQLRNNDQEELPIISFQEQKVKLYPLLAEGYAFQFASNHVLKLYAETMGVSTNKSKSSRHSPSEEQRMKLHVQSAGLKAYCSDRAMLALSTLRVACGGHGYSAWNRFGNWRNAIDITRTFEGDNTVLYQQVAKHLMHEYQQKYSSGNWFTNGLSYSTDQVNEYFKSVQSYQFHGNVRDEGYILSLLDYRVHRLTHTAALRYQNILKKLNDEELSKVDKADQEKVRIKNAFYAWNYVQNHLVKASKSSVERDIVNIFLRGVKKFQKKNPEDNATSQLLFNLWYLYALNVIQNDIGWFVGHCMNQNSAKTIQKAIIEICEQELSKDDVYKTLSAISPPDDIIDVPISLHLDISMNPEKQPAKSEDGFAKQYMEQAYKRSLRFQNFGNALYNSL